MAFDISTARPVDGGGSRFDISTAKPYGAEEDKPFGQQLNEAISDIPRQVGLTARYGIEGVGSVADMVATPFRAAVNAVAPDDMQAHTGTGSRLADALGLPNPANDRERVIGEGARMMAAGAVPIGAASKIADATSGTTNAIARLLSANPAQQISSAGAAGSAGEYTKETGGDAGSQLAAALAAGITTPMAINKAGQAFGAAGRFAKSLRPVSPVQAQQTAQQIDIHINNALEPSGLTLDALPTAVRARMRQDVAQALSAEGVLSPDAIRRLADYRLTGATPTAGTLSLDPAVVSQQKNLQKIGINSTDASAQALGRVENENNRQLITGLNDLGANTPDTAVAGGRKVMSALSARNDRAKSLINDRYEVARNTEGRSAAIDPASFTKNANDFLDFNMLGGKIPADVRNRMNAIARGDHPLTVDTAEQFRTQIAALQRASTDGAERRALGLVRQALDNAPLLEGQGHLAQEAFNSARRINRAWMGIVDRTPALQAVRDGMEPDKFVQQFIVGTGGKANIADLSALRRSVRGNPEAMNAIRGQITATLKKQALGGAADEVGNFSQSAYNKALNSIGDEKLSMFFTPEQVAQLRAIGRVASYEQFQPKGSAVNNSNTAGAALANILDRLAGSSLMSKIPFGNALQQPAQNISVGIKAGKALDVPKSLVRVPSPQKPAGLLMSPAAIMGDGEDDKRSLTNRR